MPRKRRVGRPRKRLAGKGILSALKKGLAFVKKNKFISRAGKALGDAGIPYAGNIGEVADKLGYGRRRRYRRRR